MSRAVFTGSFDPVTAGHLDIIRRAAKLYDELTVAVTVNLEKKTMFDYSTRTEMIRRACEGIPNVVVDKCEGLRAQYIIDGGFDIEIKSLRNSADFEYELPVAQMHSKLYNIETVFLMSDPALSYISSTEVRQVFSLGGDVAKMVDSSTLELMKAHR